MPGFPDKLMPFMEQIPLTWRNLANPFPDGPVTLVQKASYGPVIRELRDIAMKDYETEPPWRHNRPELTTGYHAVPDQTRLPGPGGEMQPAPARLPQRHRRLPQHGRPTDAV